MDKKKYGNFCKPQISHQWNGDNSGSVIGMLWRQPKKYECKNRVVGSMKSKLNALQRFKKGKLLKKKKKVKFPKDRGKDYVALHVSLSSFFHFKETQTGNWWWCISIVYEKNEIEFKSQNYIQTKKHFALTSKD